MALALRSSLGDEQHQAAPATMVVPADPAPPARGLPRSKSVDVSTTASAPAHRRSLSVSGGEAVAVAEVPATPPVAPAPSPVTEAAVEAPPAAEVPNADDAGNGAEAASPANTAAEATNDHSHDNCPICTIMTNYGFSEPGPTTGACSICDEPEVPLHATIHEHGNIEQWHKPDACETHAFCRECLVKWYEPLISQGARKLVCAHPDCTAVLRADDVHRFSPELSTRYREALTKNYAGRLQELDPDLDEYMKENHLRSCPDCHAIVERSEGCDSMVCLCSCEFCYQCGEQYEGQDYICGCSRGE